MKEEALARVGPQRYKKTKLIYCVGKIKIFVMLHEEVRIGQLTLYLTRLTEKNERPLAVKARL